MRLFVAAELPPALLDALAETQAALRASVRGRYVAPDSFHVTLAFLGEVDSWRVADAAQAVEAGCQGHAPIGVQLGELGSFGRSAKAALWQGFALGEGRDALAALADSVRSALKQAGFTFDAKTFLPHVTLMRGANLTEGLLPPAQLASGTIDTITLFRSDLSGERPVYESLHSATLSEGTQLRG